MTQILDTTLEIRATFLKTLAETSTEDLLKIPEGFNNNIWWNIAHVVVTQQLLIYKLSGNPLLISNELVAEYKKGTAPKNTPTSEEIQKITSLLSTNIQQTKDDFKKGRFSNYNTYTTSAGFVLNNIETAFSFNLFHEGLHAGAITALKAALKRK